MPPRVSQPSVGDDVGARRPARMFAQGLSAQKKIGVVPTAFVAF